MDQDQYIPKLYDCVEATCIHSEVGRVRGTIDEIESDDIIVVRTVRLRGYRCWKREVKLIPEEERDEALKKHHAWMTEGKVP